MSPLTYKMQRKAFEFSLIQAINWTVMPKELKNERHSEDKPQLLQ